MKTAVWMSPIDHQLEIFTSEDNLNRVKNDYLRLPK